MSHLTFAGWARLLGLADLQVRESMVGEQNAPFSTVDARRSEWVIGAHLPYVGRLAAASRKQNGRRLPRTIRLPRIPLSA